MILRIRINPKTGMGAVPLPHVLSHAGTTYTLKPDAKIEDEKYAQMQIDMHPELYEVAKGPVDLSKYTFKDTFNVKQLEHIAGKLPSTLKIRLLEFAQDLVAGNTEPSRQVLPQPAAPPGGLTDQEQQLLTSFRQLDEDDKETLAGMVQERVEQAEAARAAINDELDKHTVEELKQLAVEKKIVIPGGVTKKAEILKILRAQLAVTHAPAGGG